MKNRELPFGDPSSVFQSLFTFEGQAPATKFLTPGVTTIKKPVAGIRAMSRSQIRTGCKGRVSYIVREKKSLPRWASGTLVVTTVAGTALLLGGVANAAPLPGSLNAITTTLPVIPASIAHTPATESMIATLNPAATNDTVCNLGNLPGDHGNRAGFPGNGGDRNNLGGFPGNGGDHGNRAGFPGNGGDRNNLGGFAGNGGDRGGPGNRGIRGNLGSPCDPAIPGNFGSQGNPGILGGVQGILSRNLGGILGGLTKLGT